MKDINKDDYFLSGAVQAPLVYYYAAFKGAARAVKEGGLAITENEITRFYIGKAGSTRGRDYWLHLSTTELVSAHQDWVKQWETYDDELYQLATTTTPENWQSVWARLDELNEQLFFESYKVR